VHFQIKFNCFTGNKCNLIKQNRQVIYAGVV